MLMEIPYLGFLFRCYSGPDGAECPGQPALVLLRVSKRLTMRRLAEGEIKHA
jgi:hypothetical protein